MTLTSFSALGSGQGIKGGKGGMKKVSVQGGIHNMLILATYLTPGCLVITAE